MKTLEPDPSRPPAPSSRGFWGAVVRYGLILNGVGIVAWLALASTTWNVDHALPGLFPDFALMALGIVLAIAFNACLFVVICVRAIRLKDLRPLLYWALSVGAGLGAFYYDKYRFSLEVDALEAIDKAG